MNPAAASTSAAASVTPTTKGALAPTCSRACSDRALSWNAMSHLPSDPARCPHHSDAFQQDDDGIPAKPLPGSSASPTRIRCRAPCFFRAKPDEAAPESQTGIKQDPGRNRSRLQRKASRRPSEGGPEASGKQARDRQKAGEHRQRDASRTRRNPPRNALSPTPPRGTRPGLWEPARDVFPPAPRQEEPIGDAWERDRRDRRSRAARRRRRALRPIGRSGAPLPPSARRPASHASPACGA